MKRPMYLFVAIVLASFFYYFLFSAKTGKGQDATLRYEKVNDWPQLPEGFLLGNPTGIGIDRDQHIFVFQRAYRKWPTNDIMPDSTITSNTILEIDGTSGKILKSWGANFFIMPHGLTVDQWNNIWVTDVALHQVFKFTHDGVLLMKLGQAKQKGTDSVHFNLPTDVAVSNDGSFYVSDGYGNSRVMKFAADGKYLFQWGKPGNGPGEFNIPHAITLDEDNHVYVADRENRRVQVFDSTGKFIRQYTAGSYGNICAVYFDKSVHQLIAVDDDNFLGLKHRGSDVIVFDSTGMVTSRFGRSGFYSGQTSWYHDAAVDSQGNIYVGDILGNSLQKFKRVTDKK